MRDRVNSNENVSARENVPVHSNPPVPVPVHTQMRAPINNLMVIAKNGKAPSDLE